MSKYDDLLKAAAEIDKAISLLLGKQKFLYQELSLADPYEKLDQLGKRAGPSAHERCDLIEKRLETHAHRLAALEGGDSSGPAGKRDQTPIYHLSREQVAKSAANLRRNLRSGT